MRIILFLLFLTSNFAFGQQSNSKPQRSSIETNERVIRQDIPLTNFIRNAYEAGTRNFSGKPGPITGSWKLIIRSRPAWIHPHKPSRELKKFMLTIIPRRSR